jgi:Flp pilus assembly protein TadD
MSPEDAARGTVLRRLRMLALLLPLAACAGEAGGAYSTPPSSEINVDTLMRLGDSSRTKGNLSAAAGFYQRAHELAPDQPAPLLALADAFAGLGATDAAIQAYEAAIGLAPANAEAHRAYGNLLLQRNLPDAAEIQFTQALRQGPEARSLNGLGVAHDLLGEHAEAQANYRGALELAPGDLQIKNNLALSLALSGNHDAAIAMLEELVRDPRATPRLRQNLALAYGLAGRPDAARQLGEVDLDAAAVQHNLGYYELLRALRDTGTAAGTLGAHSADEGS